MIQLWSNSILNKEIYVIENKRFTNKLHVSIHTKITFHYLVRSLVLFYAQDLYLKLKPSFAQMSGGRLLIQKFWLHLLALSAKQECCSIFPFLGSSLRIKILSDSFPSLFPIVIIIIYTSFCVKLRDKDHQSLSREYFVTKWTQVLSYTPNTFVCRLFLQHLIQGICLNPRRRGRDKKCGERETHQKLFVPISDNYIFGFTSSPPTFFSWTYLWMRRTEGRRTEVVHSLITPNTRSLPFIFKLKYFSNGVEQRRGEIQMREQESVEKVRFGRSSFTCSDTNFLRRARRGRYVRMCSCFIWKLFKTLSQEGEERSSWVSQTNSQGL